MPNKFSRPTLTYRVLSWSLFPAVLLFTAFIAIKHRNWHYFRQRLGLYPAQENRKPLLWLHCASVGEINTALPLVKRLLAQDEQLLISTNTITGQQTLLNANLDNVTSIFLPLDYAYFAKKLLSDHSVKACLIFETELWPNIILTTHNKVIPIAIINGRIGDKTLHAPHFLHANYARALACVSKIVASSETNAQRFRSLGADAENITVLDNLKFALPGTESSTYTRPLIFPYLLCASTHADEELQIIHQWQQNKPDSLGLVIAIRHPHRAQDVCKQIQNAGLDFVLHSKRPETVQAGHIYVIDTLGELVPFIAHAEIVFMGGSLIPLGGHNVLEPARMSKCILIGPHHQDFTTIVDELVDTNGIVIVKDAADFMKSILKLNSDKTLRTKMGGNAKHYVDSKQKVLDQYVQLVENFIQTHS